MTTPDIHLFKLKSLFAIPETSFGTPETGPTSTMPPLEAWQRIPAEEIDWKPTEEYLEQNISIRSIGHVPGVIGARGGTLTFKVGLSGTHGGLAANRTTPGTGYIERLLLASCMSHVDELASQSVLSGSDLTHLKVSNISNFETGGMVAVAVGTRVQIRMITDIDSTEKVLTIDESVSAVPDTVYTPLTYAVDDSSAGSVAFFVLGDGYQYTLRGCRGTPPKITVTPRGRILLEFSFQIDHWTEEPITGSPHTIDVAPGAVARASALGFYVKTGEGDLFDKQTVPVSDITIESGLTLSPVNALQGVNGRIGFKMTDFKPSITCKPYFDASFKASFRNAESLLVIASLGGEKERSGFVAMYPSRIVALPNEVDNNGFVGQELKLQGFSEREEGPGFMLGFL
jgi:hypothetical protein